MEYVVGIIKSMLMFYNFCEVGCVKLNCFLFCKGIWKIGCYDGVYYYGKVRKEEIENVLCFFVYLKFNELENDFNQFFLDIDFYICYGQLGM